LALELPPTLNYTKEEEQWAKDEKGIKEKGDWWKLPDQRLFVPSVVAASLVKQQHELMHLGKTALENSVSIEQILVHSQASHPVCPSKC
jgi:hypothetical protein